MSGRSVTATTHSRADQDRSGYDSSGEHAKNGSTFIELVDQVPASGDRRPRCGRGSQTCRHIRVVIFYSFDLG